MAASKTMTSRQRGTGRWCTVGRRVVAWVVAAVVTAGLVTGGVLVARGGGEPSPAVLPALDLGAAGPAAADASSAAGATEPAPAPGGDRAGQAVRRPHRPAPAVAAGHLQAGRAPAVAARPGAGLEGRRQRRRRPGGHPGRRPRAARAAQAGAERLDAPGRPPRPGGAPAGRGAVVLWLRHLRRLRSRAGGGPYRPGAGIQCLDPDAPVSNQPGATPVGRPGQAVAAARPPDPGRGRAGRARPGHQGRARPEGRLGEGQRRLRHPDRHHRPGGGRRTDLRVLLDGQRRRPRRGPARLRLPGHPRAGRHLPADRRRGRLRAAQAVGPAGRHPPAGGGAGCRARPRARPAARSPARTGSRRGSRP